MKPFKGAPTGYFRRQFWVAARGDEMTLPAVVELVGDDNVVFNTDYPHPDGTWPFGMERLEAELERAEATLGRAGEILSRELGDDAPAVVETQTVIQSVRTARRERGL